MAQNPCTRRTPCQLHTCWVCSGAVETEKQFVQELSNTSAPQVIQLAAKIRQQGSYILAADAVLQNLVMGAAQEYKNCLECGLRIVVATYGRQTGYMHEHMVTAHPELQYTLQEIEAFEKFAAAFQYNSPHDETDELITWLNHNL